MRFFVGATNFWLAAAGWKGNVSFYAKPIMSKSNYVVRQERRDGVHSADVLAMAICDVYMATGGMDCCVGIWNTFTGTLKQMVSLPV